MSQHGQAYKQVSDRTFIGKVVKCIFIIANLFMLLSLVRACDGASASSLAASAVVLVAWGSINLVLGTVVMLTRRKRMIPTEDYLTHKRINKEFRKEESLRGWAIALAAWVVYTLIAGIWVAAIIGIIAGAILGYLFFFQDYRG